MSYKKEFIEFMVKSGVLTFGEFKTKSGRETPYFINTGNFKTGLQVAMLGDYYASCIIENMKKGNIRDEVTSLFGPAYKGIPISVATSIALATKYEKNINFCFNRKESKDHGEGGSMVGYQLKAGDSILIIEDVITAGTAIRECLPILKSIADLGIEGLIISVDRMERGQGNKSAIQEIEEEFGIRTYPIVTVKEILDHLYNKEIDGKVYIDTAAKTKIVHYLDEYCVIA